MRIIAPYYEILTNIDGMLVLKDIEGVARVCYKSEGNITDDSCIGFVRRLIKNGHEAMIEHRNLSVKFVCDRGISHEIVRHRLASFAQESTRYCDYSRSRFDNQITVIRPIFGRNVPASAISSWYESMKYAEEGYYTLLAEGCTPQEARAVLPNSLKTELIMTANLREWRHFFKLRTEQAAHPQMRELTVPLLKELQELIPVIFEDIIPYEEPKDTF